MKHFLYGAVMVLPIGALVDHVQHNFILLYTTIAFTIGLIKEALDKWDVIVNKQTHGVEFADIVATTLGGTYAGICLFFATK